MDWEAYRQEFSAYHAARARALYCEHAGLPVGQPLHAVYEHYSDLFRRESSEELHKGLEAGAFFTTTEKTSAQRMRDALRLEYVAARVREVDNEIARYEAASHLTWKTQPVNAGNFPEILSQETHATTRRDLTARWADCVSGGNDLFAERRMRQQQAAQELGASGLAEFWVAATGVALPTLARAAEGFLRQTESLYRAALAQLARRLWPEAERSGYSDWLFWQHHSQPHRLFPAHDLLPTYYDFLRGLGWRASAQQNLHIDAMERPGKRNATLCFAVRPPAEVIISLTPRNGVSHYRDFFACAGRAQHFAHTSTDLTRLHPAFVFTPDTAVNDGYAALFRGFFYDAAWLNAHRAGLGSERAFSLARAEALLTLAETRRLCALLSWETEAAGYADPRDETLLNSYTTRLTEATGFQYDGVFALSDTRQPFAGVGRLRGLLLAAALGDYLRVRYGRRWWAQRRAGDDLADWWNTGSHYTAEELAQTISRGELSFDLLAENLREVLQSKP